MGRWARGPLGGIGRSMTRSDVSLLRLHRLGWSIGAIAVTTSNGLRGSSGAARAENLIRAEGRTQDEAWRQAEMQALGWAGP
jgi:hypothetical protein